MNNTNQLEVIQTLTPAQIFEGGELLTIVGAIETECLSFVIDPSSEKGREEIKSLAYKIARSKTTVEKAKKAYTEDLRKKVAEINAHAANAVDRLQALQDKVREPVTQYEKREKERVASLKAKISEIESFMIVDGLTPSKQIKELLNKLEQFNPLEMEEFAHVANQVKEKVLNHLSGSLLASEDYEEKEARRIQLEAEQKEREQKEREERIAREAAENARIEAENKARLDQERIEKEKNEAIEKAKKAEEEARLANERAEKEREESVKREKEAAERAKREVIQRQEAERKKEEEEQRKRESDLAHKKYVNITALESLKIECDIDEEAGKRVITAIAMGKIPNVKINY